MYKPQAVGAAGENHIITRVPCPECGGKFRLTTPRNQPDDVHCEDCGLRADCKATKRSDMRIVPSGRGQLDRPVLAILHSVGMDPAGVPDVSRYYPPGSIGRERVHARGTNPQRSRIDVRNVNHRVVFTRPVLRL